MTSAYIDLTSLDQFRQPNNKLDQLVSVKSLFLSPQKQKRIQLMRQAVPGETLMNIPFVSHKYDNTSTSCLYFYLCIMFCTLYIMAVRFW